MPLLKEESIRPTHLMADKEGCIVHDRKFLLDRMPEWLDVACPACESRVTSFFAEKNGFTYVTCSHCETVYTNPRPSLEVLHDFYGQSQNYTYWNKHIFPATEEARRERIFKPRAQRLVDCLHDLDVEMDTLIEVGAAFGTFCEELRRINAFERIIAIEPTPGLAQTCRQRGFEVIEDAIENIEINRVANVVAAFEVLEHLFSPADFIEHCRRLLKPGGLLVVSCPNVQGFDVSALGIQSSTFDHEHLNYLHPASLSQLVTRCGFEVLECMTPGQLDADIVRTSVLSGELDIQGQAFLHEVLLRRWDEVGPAFQDFLSSHCMSSHMWLIARRDDSA